MLPNLSNNNDPQFLKNLLEQRLRQLEERFGAVFKQDGSIELNSHRKIEIAVGGSRVSIDASGVSVRSAGTVKVDAPRVELVGTQTRVQGGGVLELSAGVVKLESPLTQSPGMVKCEVLQATSVVGASYTPGAGNVW